MAKGILGRKVGMTQVFDPETGVVTPVTVIEAGPCKVLQVRTPEKDGYSAIQLGFGEKARPKKDQRSRQSQASRAERGHVADIKSKRSQKLAAAGVLREKANCEPAKFVREIRDGEAEIGSDVKVDALAEVLRVDVMGISKGRGTAGVMKRHNFSGQRATHGVKKCHRHAGGTGMSAYPSRTFKGKRMAGRYGNAQVTVRNLNLVRIDEENNLLLVEGAVPGPTGGYLVVRETNMKK